MELSSRHRKMLRAVFADPVRADVKWADVETLLHALGVDIGEGRGLRVRIQLNGVRAVFHRPHPIPDTDKGALRSLRRFLIEAGVKPEE
ncbi:type II toxin-antitoxin system HicA family toxin [Candidatus Chloroploca sp. Khr17]|uniref:type II toxin-antitoxin system HicA family toxin n=1 Tax=Candidatus Chloroploca sp. Khr17 TaxID=2496869 RepID=UPI00101DF2B5